MRDNESNSGNPALIIGVVAALGLLGLLVVGGGVAAVFLLGVRAVPQPAAPPVTAQVVVPDEPADALPPFDRRGREALPGGPAIEVAPAPHVARAKPVASLTAVQLWNTYGMNELTADGDYKGKYLDISGSVQSVNKGADGRYVVGFAVVAPAALNQRQLAQLSPRERKWFKDGYPPNVVCYFSKENEAAFADVKIGKEVTVTAKVVGRKSADVWRDYVVELDNAALVK